MMRSMSIAILATIAVSCSAGIVLANNTEIRSSSSPMLGQLELRDRKVTLTLVPSGYLYSVTDESGTILNADLTEAQLAEQYPDLLDLLRPAIAEGETEMMMLAPKMN